MDLEKLYESSEQKVWLTRPELIRNIKKSGRYYNFDKYTDAGLYRIWERIKKEAAEEAAMQEYAELLNADTDKICDFCGAKLSDGGSCPVCDDGEEDAV
jgi:rubrerythrin